MADSKRTFDFESFARDELGGRVVGMGEEPGTVKLEVMGEDENGALGPQVKTFDVNSFLKNEVGADPSQVNLQYNTADSAVDDSPLGFIDRFKYEVARTPADKARFLKEKFGAENLKFDANSGRFKVNNKGIWHDADSTGIAGFLGGEGDVIAGATAGGAAGAKLGALAGPMGAVAGGAIGSSIGAVMARLGTIDSAKQVGLRSEQDAEEVAQELGKEALLALGGEVAAVGVKAGVRTISKAISGMASKATTPLAKRELAQTMEMMTGVPAVDNMTWLDSPREVSALQKRVIDWEAAGQRGVNPVKKEMADAIQETVQIAKNDMYSKFKKTLDPLQAITKDVEVDIAPVMSDMVAQYKEMGLIDESLNWVTKAEEGIRKVVNPSSVKRLRETYDIIKRGTSAADGAQQLTKLPFDDTRTLIKNMDEILEAAGQYNIGPIEITTPAKARIVGIRAGLDNALTSSLAKKNPEAAALYKQMNASFSKRREWIDDVSAGLRDEKIDATMKRMLGPDGDRSREVMLEALKDSGVNSELFMNMLYQGRAALNSTKIYKNTGMTGVIGGQMRMTSPQRTTPLAAKTFNRIKGMAEATNFVAQLPKQQRADLIRSPDMMRAIRQMTIQAIQAADQGGDMLVQQALQESAPAPTPLLPREEQGK